jgi:hypothetical protein
MAKRKITVATKNEQIYKLSFELTKPFSGDEYDLLSARPYFFIILYLKLGILVNHLLSNQISNL